MRKHVIQVIVAAAISLALSCSALADNPTLSSGGMTFSFDRPFYSFGAFASGDRISLGGGGMDMGGNYGESYYAAGGCSGGGFHSSCDGFDANLIVDGVSYGLWNSLSASFDASVPFSDNGGGLTEFSVTVPGTLHISYSGCNYTITFDTFSCVSVNYSAPAHAIEHFVFIPWEDAYTKDWMQATSDPVPEPASFILLASGLTGLGYKLRRSSGKTIR